MIPSVNTKGYRKTIKKHNRTISSIKEHRKKLAAHRDQAYQSWRPNNNPQIRSERARTPSIEYGKTKDLLKDCQDIFNNISSTYSRDIWSFEFLDHSHTIYLLDKLEALEPTR